jgi:hypothetical protein
MYWKACGSADVPQAERQDAERKVVLLEEQVVELQKEAENSAAESAAALTAAANRSKQEIAILKVRHLL